MLLLLYIEEDLNSRWGPTLNLYWSPLHFIIRILRFICTTNKLVEQHFFKKEKTKFQNFLKLLPS